MTAAAGSLGLTEYFRMGEHDRVGRALDAMERLGIGRLRTALSWAEWHRPGGAEWYDWLLPTLAARVDVLPMVHYTPPSLGVTAKSSSPPRRPRDFADFVDTVVTRYGRCFTAIELWNEPNNINDWDYLQDPDWNIFCDMIGAAAYWARMRGKKTVLPGTCPTDCSWLDLLCRRGVLAHIDVVGVHAFPDTWDFDGRTWDELLAGVSGVLARHGLAPEIWITETGYSTWRHDEWRQAEKFLQAVENLPDKASRLYWYSLDDLSPDLPHQEGFHADERHYHTGLRRHDGGPKLLARLLKRGGPGAVAGLRAATSQARGGPEPRSGRTLLLGGAGRIGAALADRLLEEGAAVTVYDNLAATGSVRRITALAESHGARTRDLRILLADVRDPYALRQALAGVDLVFDLTGLDHLDGSADPVRDCDVLVRGRLLLLEELRRLARPPRLVAAGTVGVYQPLSLADLVEDRGGLVPRDPILRTHGIAEDHPLAEAGSGHWLPVAREGAVLAAAAAGLPASVLRLGPVHGPANGPDSLFAVAGQAFAACPDLRAVRDFLPLACNVAGGPANAMRLGDLAARTPAAPGMGRWPTPDGPPAYLVCDHRLFSRLTGWMPRSLAAHPLETPLCPPTCDPSRTALPERMFSCVTP